MSEARPTRNETRLLNLIAAMLGTLESDLYTPQNKIEKACRIGNRVVDCAGLVPGWPRR